MISRLVILLAFLTAPCALRAVDRPNLVFILADDLGWSDGPPGKLTAGDLTVPS
jgi:hypothetical protein